MQDQSCLKHVSMFRFFSRNTPVSTFLPCFTCSVAQLALAPQKWRPGQLLHPKKSFGSGVLGSATAQRHAACCSDTDAAAAALTLSLLLRLDLSLLLLLFCVLPGEVTKINTHVWRYIRRDDDVDVQMNSLLIVPIAFRLPTCTPCMCSCTPHCFSQCF